MEFLDQNDYPLEIGDEIEYWSSRDKDWKKAKVVTIEAIRSTHRVQDDIGGWKSEPRTVTKIKVGKWRGTDQTGVDRYSTNYDLLNLKRPEVIRKVL